MQNPLFMTTTWVVTACLWWGSTAASSASDTAGCKASIAQAQKRLTAGLPESRRFETDLIKKGDVEWTFRIRFIKEDPSHLAIAEDIGIISPDPKKQYSSVMFNAVQIPIEQFEAFHDALHKAESWAAASAKEKLSPGLRKEMGNLGDVAVAFETPDRLILAKKERTFTVIPRDMPDVLKLVHLIPAQIEQDIEKAKRWEQIEAREKQRAAEMEKQKARDAKRLDQVLK
jgi:hypothetical protein